MSRRATRAHSRLTDSEDVDAPGTDPGSPVLAPASPQQETSWEGAEARVDTPRPAAKAQGAIYRNENGILRTASAARARALDMPPPAPRTVLFQTSYTTSAVVRMVGIDGRALARDYSLRPVLG